MDINNSDGLKIPSGTVNERPTTLKKGIIRYNLELDQFEGYGAGNAWGSLGGVIDVNQDTFVRAEKTAGIDNNELELIYVSNRDDVIEGDMIVTSGIDEIYPSGLPVARVKKVKKNQNDALAFVACEPHASLFSNKYCLNNFIFFI